MNNAIQFPSEANGNYSAYMQAVCDGVFSDSLSNRISAGVKLTDSEIVSLLTVLTKRCRQITKDDIEVSLRSVPSLRNYGIYSRVLVSDRGSHDSASYCAGQDYSEELRTIRRLLK